MGGRCGAHINRSRFAPGAVITFMSWASAKIRKTHHFHGVVARESPSGGSIALINGGSKMTGSHQEKRS